MNTITIIGNLTNDVRYAEPVSNGQPTPVASFGIATNIGRGDTQQTDYFNVTAWRNLAQNCRDYLKKGRKVAVTGSVHLRKYTPTQGPNTGREVSYMEVRATGVEFLSPREREEAPAVVPAAPAAAPAAAPVAQAPAQYAAPAQTQVPAPAAGYVQFNENDLPF